MGQQPGPAQIDFLSQGARVHGKAFAAPGAGLKPTVLVVPGWPGNPDDVVALGESLPSLGVNMIMFNPRGMHASEGSFGFGNTLADIDAAFAWLAREDVQRRFNIDPARMALAGHSFRGGMAMVYGSSHPNLRRLIAISPADLGETVNGLLNDPSTQSSMRQRLTAPGGFPVRVADLDATFQELKADGNRYGINETAPRVADRSILLIGGWEDQVVTVDQTILPYYRALKKAGAADVTFLVYHADHQFRSVKQKLASDIRDWLKR
jgi:pimeloyl-ACP methyl ester carboxylesterase